MAHTPTPWVHPPETLQIVAASGKMVGNMRSGVAMRFPPSRSRNRRLVPRAEAEANAALAVRAVNLHADLVAAVRAFRATVPAGTPLAEELDALLNRTEQ